MNFTEHDFVALLFNLLSRNGITKIDEKALVKKLWYYYQNSENKELFQDILCVKDPLVHEVNLQDGLYLEKWLSGNIWSENLLPNILHFHYDDNRDLSRYEGKLSQYGVLKMHQIAYELAQSFIVEQESNIKMSMYHTDPNQTYILANGLYLNANVNTRLITDGNFQVMEHPDQEAFSNCYFPDPVNEDARIQLEQLTITEATLENASYAMQQEIQDKGVRRVEVFTQLSDLKQLRKIKDIADENLELSSDIVVRKRLK